MRQKSALLMHRARDLLIRQRTMLVNALRAHMVEGPAAIEKRQ
jgi:transposase